MNKLPITFYLNNSKVEAKENETIWQVANRLGIEIPHLCYLDKPSYRADGNCRACMVEIEGERVLAASCIRKPTENLKVFTSTKKAKKSRKLVFELLLADQPKREIAHDNESQFWNWIDKIELKENRFPKKTPCAPDVSHPSMAVNLDACIQCNLCVRACREVQVNDVIGMAYRGENSKIVFDFDDPMGESTCVACGECVQACPTGALMPASVVDEKGIGHTDIDNKVESVCPYCGVGCQIEYTIQDNKIKVLTSKFIDLARGRAKGITVDGLNDIMLKFGKCCTPIPGDSIIGYLTKGQGVTVHRAECKSITRLKNPDRFVNVEWNISDKKTFIVRLKMIFEDRKNLLKDLTDATSTLNIYIKSIDMKAEDSVATCLLVVEISNKNQLDKLIQKLQQVQSIDHIERF